ncbi:DNA polymerase III subunit alpha, partial [Candidatus Uhrbacteria bacterium]|nr:DNA polymerase III subunit alpha [Candidatus Uhrbacteria bacterium]
AELFKETPEAISNTLKVAEKCNLEIPIKKLHFPKFAIPESQTPDTFLKQNSYRGLARRYKLTETEDIAKIKAELDQNHPAVSERLEYELKIIAKKGYSEYMLIVADFVNWATAQGIITTTRGSAAGSLTSYSIGILNINPLDYNLPFERFLTMFRPSPPDIDLDIADNRRGEVIDYVVQKYGKERVAHIITFGTMMARAAARDVGRALGMTYDSVDRIAKMIPMGSQGFPMYIDRAKQENPDLGKAYKNEPETKKLLDLAERVEGCCRHASVHAAGIVIAPRDLTEFTPLQLDTDNKQVITQYEMGACESVGLVKMDFLGIRNLSILGEAIKIIENKEGIKINLEAIPLDDKKTFAMLTRGETFGVFQLGGSGMTKYLVELKPEKIFDIMAMIALYRPGPIDSIPDYIKRKNNPKLVRVLDPRMRDILNMSYGIITFQDDVLLIAINIAGYSWEEADKLRKAMGKKIPAEMAKQKEKFIQGCIEKGQLTPEKAQQLFKLIEPFAAYGFNKAHAASYAHISYYTGYLKANYPVEYMAAVMTAESGDIEKIGEAIKECQHIGLAVLPPDINESQATFTVVERARGEQKQIRFGLTAVKNVGEGVVQSIIEERTKNGPFISLDDFVSRVHDKNLNKKILESLAKAGALDRFADRQAILENVENLLSYSRAQVKAKLSGQNSLFGTTRPGTGQAKDPTALSLKLIPSAPATLKDKLKWEKELLGLYILQHPFAGTSAKLKDMVWPVNLLGTAQKGSNLMLAGIVVETKKVTTKKGEAMMFVQLEDLTGKVELVVFPKAFFNSSKSWVEDAEVLVKGKVDTKDEEVKILVESVMVLTESNIDEIISDFAKMKARRAEYQKQNPPPAGPVVSNASTVPASGSSQGPQYLNSVNHRVPTSFKVNFNDDLRKKIEGLTGHDSVELV